jgi:hypothetical protein
LDLIEKPPKVRLITTAKEYFARNPNAMFVGILTKEGRQFYFRRDPRTGEPMKTTRAEAQKRRAA